MAFITTVWAAPAEKAFVNSAGTGLGVGDRTVKVFIGLGFAAVAVGCMLIGAVETARQSFHVCDRSTNARGEIDREQNSLDLKHLTTRSLVKPDDVA